MVVINRQTHQPHYICNSRPDPALALQCGLIRCGPVRCCLWDTWWVSATARSHLQPLWPTDTWDTDHATYICSTRPHPALVPPTCLTVWLGHLMSICCGHQSSSAIVFMNHSQQRLSVLNSFVAISIHCSIVGCNPQTHTQESNFYSAKVNRKSAGKSIRKCLRSTWAHVTDWMSCGFTSHSTQNRSFQRRFPQANLLAWYGKTKPNTTKAHIHQSEEMHYNIK